MNKILEDYLWSEISNPSEEEIWKSEYKRSPREVIKEMIDRGWINSPKQGYSTLKKWLKKGIYEYGSCLDLGWKCKRY